MKLSASTSEMSSAIDIVSANGRKNAPATPLSSASGSSTATGVNVEPTSARVISFSAAATSIGCVRIACRCTFSITTMASSRIEPDAGGDGAERHQVEAHSERVYRQTGDQHRGGNDRCRSSGGTPIAGEDEEGGDGEQHAQRYRLLYVGDHALHQFRLIVCDREAILRMRLRERTQPLAELTGDRDRIAARLHRNAEQHCRLPVGDGADEVLAQARLDVRDRRQRHRRAAVLSDDDVEQARRFGRRAAHDRERQLMAVADLARRRDEARTAYGGFDGRQIETVRRQRVGIDDQGILAHLGALQIDAVDARNRAQLRSDLIARQSPRRRRASAPSMSPRSR